MSNSITQSPAPGQTPARPSDRDLEIYKGYVILQHQQVSISHMYNISRPRIAQIVGKVRRWLAAGGSPADPAIREHLAQERLATATKRLRLMRIIERATYASEARLPSQKKVKSRYQGTTEVWREEIADHSPEINLPALRLLLRAVKELDELEARHDQPLHDRPRQTTEPAPPATEDQLLRSVFDLLCRWRSRAESAGHFPSSPDIPALVSTTLNSLLGAILDPQRQTFTLPAISANSKSDVSPPLTRLVAPNPTQPPLCETTNLAPEEKVSSKC